MKELKIERSKTVLVVEDDQSFREFMRMFLSDKGFTVHVAESPSIALNVIHQGLDIDLAYIDINYEGSKLTGFDFITEAKRNGLQFPFVIMSMDDDLENHQGSESIGALAFVEKHYESIEASIEHVKSILSKNDQQTTGAHQVFNRYRSHSYPLGHHSGSNVVSEIDMAE